MCQISGVQPHMIEGVYILSLGLSALPYQIFFYDRTPTSGEQRSGFCHKKKSDKGVRTTPKTIYRRPRSCVAEHRKSDTHFSINSPQPTIPQILRDQRFLGWSTRLQSTILIWHIFCYDVK